MDKELLYTYGIDYDKGLSNCNNDINFYKKILAMFLDDKCFKNAQIAHAERDYNKLFNLMHELKGMSSNVACTKLYEATIKLVELLRGGTDDHVEVDRMFTVIENAYIKVCEGIKLFTTEI